MEKNNYDVVIVGSGIAGAITAQLLTNAGKKVLLLEAGLQAGIAMNQEANYAVYQEYLNTYYEAAAKVPNAPYPNLKDAPSPNVLDLAPITPVQPLTNGYFVQMGPQPFASDNTRTPGGTTLHWLGTTLRMLPSDFKMRTLYKVGVDWPIPYAEMDRYYTMAENEIGVSGNVADQNYPNDQKAYAPNYVLPMREIPTSYLDKVMGPVISGKKIEMNGQTFTLDTISTPQGRNSVPNENYKIAGVVWNPASKKLELVEGHSPYDPVGSNWSPYTGQRCEGNASCVPICPVQAKYNALKSLRKCDPGNLTVRTQSVASQLIINPVSKWIDGVQYKVYKNPTSP